MSIETTDKKINNKRLATQQSVNWVFRGRYKAIEEGVKEGVKSFVDK